MEITIFEFAREYNRQELYIPIMKNIKRGLNYFDNFFLFFYWSNYGAGMRKNISAK